jgi:hypothetical protein
MNDQPRRRADLLGQAVGEDLMLYDTTGRMVHVLSHSARYVWDRCDGEHTVETLVQEAAADFSAAEAELQTDIQECLDNFRSLSLLEE